MSQSNLARNCEAIVEIDRDIVAICCKLDERGREPHVYDRWLDMLEILTAPKQALLNPCRSD